MKRLVILVGALLVFLMLLSLLLPQSVSVAKTVTINAPQKTIVNEVSDFANWPQWFPVLKEHLATLSVQSADEAVIQRPSGKNIEVKCLFRTTDSVAFVMRISSGASQKYTFTMQPLQDGGIRTDLIVSREFNWYPWQRAQSLFMEKLTGPQFEEVLKNLQTQCEGAE